MKKLGLVIVLLCLSMAVSAGGFMFKHLEVKDGLSSNRVNDIFKDSEGFMWFATASGLNRYDGCQMKVYRSHNLDLGPLPDNCVQKVQEDGKKRLWIRTAAGYTIYDSKTESFNRDVHALLWEAGIDGIPALTYIDKNKNMWFYIASKGCYLYIPESQLLYPLLFDAGQLPEGEITDISECSDGVLLVYNTGMIVCLNRDTNKINWDLKDISKELGNNKYDTFSFFVDKENDIWIYSPSGLWIYNPAEKKWQKKLRDLINRQSRSAVLSVAQDLQGRIWIGREHDGVNILNKSTGEIKTLMHQPDDERSLQDNTVSALYEDPNGMMWLGTWKKGISYYHESIFKFSLDYVGDVTAVEEDKNGDLWIGTNNDGLIHWKINTGEPQLFVREVSDANSLSSDAVSCLLRTRDGKLWIGTLGGGLDCYDNGRFTHYKNMVKNSKSLTDNNIVALAEDKSGIVWIGTSGSGLQSLNPRTGEFNTYNTTTSDLAFNTVSSLYITRDNSLMIGTSRGLSVMDLSTKKIISLTGTKSGKTRFSNQNINQVYEDSRGLIWIATREGLNIYNPKIDELTILAEKNGLSNLLTVGIVEDDNSNMWITSAKGLTHIIPMLDSKTGMYDFRCNIYDERDGLQSSGFNQRSVKKLSSGEIVIGGVYGINRFFSDKIKYNEVLPNVFFTHFLLFNKEVEVGEVYGDKVILDKALNFVDQVELDYKQNMVCVQFASDNYIIPEKVEYAYKLEGFSDEWITTKTGEAVYTNLFPGTYLLRVKAINSDGFSGNEEASLKIVVTPPFWLSTWACILYVILFVGIMLLMCSKMCGGKRKSGQSEEQSEIGEDESDEESEELEQPGSYKPEEKVTSEEESDAVLLAHDESISSEVVDEVVSKAVEEEEVVEIKTIESVLEEKKEIDTVSTIKTQRARVIQLIEDENSDEYTTYIVPEDELPEVIITAGSKKVDGIIPPAISEMIGTKKAVSHSGNDESVDEKLLGAAMKYVESNISRSDLSVEELSRELGMSRVNLYKRLVAMTGKTPIEFIRVIRLKHAAKLLRETRMNISEVAYQVGFNNPKYFTKYFKEEFGMLPSVYQEKEKQEQGE